MEQGRLAMAQYQTPGEGMTGDLLCSDRNEHRLTGLTGDVAGRGTGASHLAAEIRQMIRLGQGLASPGDLLPRLNRYLLQRTIDQERFVTALLAVVNPQARRLTVWNAGHPRPLFIHRGQVEPIGGSGIVLGVTANLCIRPTTRSLAPRDALVVFSDGLTDAQSLAGHRLDEDGLRRLVQQHHELQPEDLVIALLADVCRFGRLDDDATVCVIQYISA
jgi:sigma-B regulation protein RsbU (phosphoserine phosphatase)